MRELFYPSLAPSRATLRAWRSGNMFSFGRSGGDLFGAVFFALIQREASGRIYAGEGFSKARRDAGK